MLGIKLKWTEPQQKKSSQSQYKNIKTAVCECGRLSTAHHHHHAGCSRMLQGVQVIPASLIPCNTSGGGRGVGVAVHREIGTLTRCIM
ncbi:hypothetical protein E2C01_073403 [Portunus trituberculatus]|uniref:Uncharacterized protein n=1 Tax=Portunus trituberculatus TaxID=210409 RepID=A0A5B7IDG3_PORTR|nr:hypothetical protein [Portunus trituberculatus]